MLELFEMLMNSASKKNKNMRAMENTHEHLYSIPAKLNAQKYTAHTGTHTHKNKIAKRLRHNAHMYSKLYIDGHY